jgi:hypothetical protein
MIIIGGILVLFIYIKILASNEIFSPSNKIYREVGRTKDLSAPRYIEATRSVLEIFKMAGYFPDSPHITHTDTESAPHQLSCFLPPVCVLETRFNCPVYLCIYYYEYILETGTKFIVNILSLTLTICFGTILPSSDEIFVILVPYSVVTVTLVSDPSGYAA